MGDQVLSRDPQTGKDEAKTVTATVERHAPVIVDVMLHDARTGKAETLTCTPEHPLYVQGQGWVEAGSVGIGTSIVSRAGPALQVTGLTWEKNKAEDLAVGSAGSSFGGYTVYNLTVDSDHTFFVGSADGGTWVHNLCAVKGSASPVLTKVATEIDKAYPGMVKGWGEGHVVNGQQVDVELANDVWIEVKDVHGGGSIAQMQRYLAANPNGISILYAERMSTAVTREMNKIGVLAAGGRDASLKNVLIPVLHP